MLGAALTGVVLLSSVVQRGLSEAIPPPWANATLNPCANESWQLLYWPKDASCYKIFSQGPCKRTQQFYFDSKKREASCRCKKDSLLHKESQLCYRQHSRGPCKLREYFDVDENGEAICQEFPECPLGQVFWPTRKKCYEHHTQGPCSYGQLLFINLFSGFPECGCIKEIMSINYWQYRETCHEHYTQGPCVHGHIFLYNATKQETECTCASSILTNYHTNSNLCYELNTQGPCRPGNIFVFDIFSLQTTCKCLDGFIKWTETGECYRQYTKGPCQPGMIIVPHPTLKEHSMCTTSPCKSGRLYDPDTKKCYIVGTRGPCNYGKLFVYERATSQRGICQCNKQLVGYWDEDGACYQLGKRGPCSPKKILAYNKENGTVSCECDYRRGYIPFHSSCIKGSQHLKRLTKTSIVMPNSNMIMGRSLFHDNSTESNNLMVLSNTSFINAPREKVVWTGALLSRMMEMPTLEFGARILSRHSKDDTVSR